MDINITPEIKKYLVERIGEAETAKLIHAVKMNRNIMLTGPAYDENVVDSYCTVEDVDESPVE